MTTEPSTPVHAALAAPVALTNLTIDIEAQGVAVQPRTIVITGADGDLAAQIACRMRPHDVRLILVGSTTGATAGLAHMLDVEWITADARVLDQIRRAAAWLQSTAPRIDALVHATSVHPRQHETTDDGLDAAVQVNYTAPFLLTTLLLDALTAGGGRVVTAVSTAASRGEVNLYDFGRPRSQIVEQTFADTQLARVLLTRELHRREHAHGINTVAFSPGLRRHELPISRPETVGAAEPRQLDRRIHAAASRGAQHAQRLLTADPGRAWTSGRYYSNQLFPSRNTQLEDDNLARWLWDHTQQQLYA